MEKYLNNDKLTNTEKTYLYSAIKKKIDALRILREEFYITGAEMIKDRVDKAKEILNELGKDKAFISGTFLFSETYNDIDIYIISKKRKSYEEDNKHFILITEEDLRKPIFISASKYCVSTFFTGNIIPIIKRPEFGDVLFDYQFAINEILENDDQKMTRSILLDYYVHIKHEIIDSFSLYKKWNEIKNKKQNEKIEIINQMTKELFLSLYSNKYTYNELSPFIKRIRKDLEDNPQYSNFGIYADLLAEVKNECRRAKT